MFYPMTLEYKSKTIPTADFILKETEKKADLSINRMLQKLFHNTFTALSKAGVLLQSAAEFFLEC